MIIPIRPNLRLFDAVSDFFRAIDRPQIIRHFHPHAFNHKEAQKLCAYQGKDEYFVAMLPGKVVGYGMLRGWDEGYSRPSLGVCVHPGFSGRGIGKNLVRHLILVAHRRGAQEVFLKVNKDNTRAVALYREVGFTLTELNATQWQGTIATDAIFRKNSKELTLLITTINEADNLKKQIPLLKQVFDGVGADLEILIVDGGSSDETVDTARSLGCRVEVQSKPGYASAISQGLKSARGRYLIVMDADGSHSAEDALNLYQNRMAADIVINSRYVAGGGSQAPFLRRKLSELLNALYRIYLRLPFREVSGGFRIYRTSLLDLIDCRSRFYEIQEELLILPYWLGFSAIEIPYVYRDREYGVSKAKLITFGVRLLASLESLRKRRRFAFKFPC